MLVGRATDWVLPMLPWVLAAMVGCEKPAEPVSGQTSAAVTAATSVQATPVIEWKVAADGEVAALVSAEVLAAKRDGRTLLVYVGATWCEPCKRFHAAAEGGFIKGDLPPLRMLEFDLDKDAERLFAAGYGSKMIPLFAVPGPDGRGTELKVEGSVKGPGAVSNIVPRLSAMLARARGS